MKEGALEELANVDEAGRMVFRIAAAATGHLVLCRPEAPLQRGLRELDVEERVRLAEASAERPALVVEGPDGHYVVVTDEVVDLDEYVPLGPADVELLASGAARAVFGRRDDDVLTLTPWAEEDEIVVVDLDGSGFDGVPVVALGADGSLEWERGGVDEELVVFVRRELERLDARPGMRVGVLTNMFGECRAVLDGEPLLPHEDVRHQTLMTTQSLLDGAETLTAAAERLRSIADRLSAAEEQGWRLLQPVTDGIAFAEREEEYR